MFNGKRVLITGGTGAWGQEIAAQLLKTDVYEIIILSRGRKAQKEMEFRLCDARLLFVEGDIKDVGLLQEIFIGVDYVFHTAGMKYTDDCETDPWRALQENIIGTKNVIDACIDREVKICVNISSTKINDANCFYGKTKAITESLIVSANNHVPPVTKFISIRSGNILGSRGTTIAKWIEQLKSGNKDRIDAADVKRFFIPVKTAVRYTFEAMKLCQGGEVFVFRMVALYLYNIAKALARYYFPKGVWINVCKPPLCERRIEWLVRPEEGFRTIAKGHFFIIYPLIPVPGASYPKIRRNKDIENGYCMDDYPVINSMDAVEKMFKVAGLIPSHP
jgi:UDP-N-acetylglucosamine 4,6-dehydratase/5-epimerase